MIGDFHMAARRTVNRAVNTYDSCGSKPATETCKLST
jgi:hypothetical protein